MEFMTAIDLGAENFTAQRKEIEELLAKYPNLNDEENSKILEFLTNAPGLETALLTCNEDIRSQLESFKADHRSELGFGPKEYLLLACILISIAITVYLSWDAGI
jgi:hypothetical protein